MTNSGNIPGLLVPRILPHTREECARLIVETMKQELGDLLQPSLGIAKIKRSYPGGRAGFINDGLSGTTDIAQAFIDTGVEIGVTPKWFVKLEKVGVTSDDFRAHGFLSGRGQLLNIDVSAIVEANGRYARRPDGQNETPVQDYQPRG